MKSPVDRHARESGYPLSKRNYENISGMDSRFHGNDIFMGRK